MTLKMHKKSYQRKAKLYPLQLQYDTALGATVTFTTLSKLTLLQLDTRYLDQPNTLKIETVKTSLLEPTDIELLIAEDVEPMYELIISSSVVSTEEYTNLAEALQVKQDEKYQDDTFISCELCQEKGLDKLRNCPMIDKSKHNPKLIPYTFTEDKNKLTRVCPMYHANNSEDLAPTFELLSMLELGTLPVSGGMLEQTMFVNEVSRLVKPIIDRKKIPMML